MYFEGWWLSFINNSYAIHGNILRYLLKCTRRLYVADMSKLFCVRS